MQSFTILETFAGTLFRDAPMDVFVSFLPACYCVWLINIFSFMMYLLFGEAVLKDPPKPDLWGPIFNAAVKKVDKPY